MPIEQPNGDRGQEDDVRCAQPGGWRAKNNRHLPTFTDISAKAAKDFGRGALEPWRTIMRSSHPESPGKIMDRFG